MARDSKSISTQWRVLGNVGLHWKLLSDQYLVYNSASGHTHVLDPIAALLIQQLTERSLETDELVQRIAFLLNVEVTEELHVELEQILWQLDKLFLVESVIS